ncbi:NUMOD4 motif-containing HNH endonuclease [Corynebacterium yonathiae]|uniref:NUMOD4 motif-containing HNH endonuclease n=1 Tax=Corynebacterium yonathiae TaxID=2913504 RepID=A0A9X3LZ12_9CORY|nr:NUMOD4 motif-containing HNH endonuclease [Corynebacterium yonathiae]MCZ9296685.1 NUMOD4 motif-containing HNH endonuclease [Corynebacterium yonathiae]
MYQPTNIEQWRPVVGYEGLYEISNKGRVLSLRYNRMLKPWKPPRGGLQVHLTKNKTRKMNQIHRMVYSAFIGEIPDEHVVRHLNDNPEDNRPENLITGTPQDNTNDMLRNSGHYRSKTTACPRNHPLVEGNLVLGQLKRGHRSCLSCDRARIRVKRNPSLGTLKDESDRIFRKLHDDGNISDAAYMSWRPAKQ